MANEDGWALRDVVAGRYRLTAVIGTGGMGIVYEAEDLVLGIKVALKMLHRRLAWNTKFILRFQREGRTVAALRHPAIVRIFDLGQDRNGNPYLVMERLFGTPLNKVLGEGRLPAERAIRVADQLLEALGLAHQQGVIHRDVKPENIFLARMPGCDEQPTILDFGIAKLDAPLLQAAGCERLTTPGMIVGTLIYMSPEQLADPGNVDGRADLYSVGVILYEMLTGCHPLAGIDAGDRMHLLRNLHQTQMLRRPRQRCAAVPVWLDELVYRALAPNRDTRYANAAAMLEALRAGGKAVHIQLSIPAERVASEPVAALPQPPDDEYDLRWYIRREAEELRALKCLSVAGMPVVLQAPRLYGKATLLAHLLGQARSERTLIRRITMSELSPSELCTLDALLEKIGSLVAETVWPDDAERWLTAASQRSSSAQCRLNWLLDRALGKVASLGSHARLLLSFEKAERLHGCPFHPDFFRLLRSWAEDRSATFQHLRLLLTVATEPTLLEQLDSSSFFALARPIRLTELGSSQLTEMACQHGLVLSAETLRQGRALLAGHPYLWRLLFFEAVLSGEAPDQLLAARKPADNLFTSHLCSLWASVERHNLRPALSGVLRDPAFRLDFHAYCRLYSEGLVIIDDSGEYRMRCGLYDDYFRTLLGLGQR